MADRVMVGYPFGEILPEFMHCLDAVKSYDSHHGQHLMSPKGWKIAVGGNNIALQRNKIISAFLETDADWLWFIDTDQTFEPDIIEQLLDSADKNERPLISGLVQAYRPGRPEGHRVTPACVVLTDDQRLAAPNLIPPDRWWEVAAIGAGCLFAHRTVFEKIAAESVEETAYPWFEYKTWKRLDADGKTVVDSMGEDYVFSLRAGAAGFPILVDTDIRCGHIKPYEFTDRDFWEQVPYQAIPERTYVIIPVKDQRVLTEKLLNQLAEQGSYHDILVLDNGSAKETRRYLERQTIARVLPMPGVGIHQMWNEGVNYALSMWPKVNLAILNNDLNIGPDFLAGLSAVLRSREDLVAVSPNYDGRTLDGILECNQICANRYDGTGGAPGFAFMVKGELFQTGYRFPEDAMWWYGDNDLLLTIRAGGGAWAITPDVTVEHVGGGGKTGNWSDYSETEQGKKDRAAFLARWAS